MSSYVKFFYATLDDLKPGFPGWREPLSEPTPVTKNCVNPFTNEEITVETYDYELPEGEWTEEGFPDHRKIKDFEILSELYLPASLIELLDWKGPPALCHEYQEAEFHRVPDDKLQQLLTGELEQQHGGEDDGLGGLVRDLREAIANNAGQGKQLFWLWS